MGLAGGGENGREDIEAQRMLKGGAEVGRNSPTSRRYPLCLRPCERSARSIRKQSINVDLGASTDIDPSVRHCWHGKFHSISGGVPVTGRLRAIPQLGGKIRRVVGVEYGSAKTVGARDAVLARIDWPGTPPRKVH